jgi:hypothetical protein
MVKAIKMDAAVTCADISSSGVLAVALQGSAAHMPTRTGSLHFFTYPGGAFVHETRDAKVGWGLGRRGVGENNLIAFVL